MDGHIFYVCVCFNKCPRASDEVCRYTIAFSHVFGVELEAVYEVHVFRGFVKCGGRTRRSFRLLPSFFSSVWNLRISANIYTYKQP